MHQLWEMGNDSGHHPPRIGACYISTPTTISKHEFQSNATMELCENEGNTPRNQSRTVSIHRKSK